MLDMKKTEVDTLAVKKMLDRNKSKINLSLKACAHCSLCAESCFLYMANDKKPEYMPSYKFINSIGLIYKKRGKVDIACLEKIRDIVWEDCVLCTRCYCVIGIDIPGMISFARNICRSQGIFPAYDE